jgi:hypothetical protein
MVRGWQSWTRAVSVVLLVALTASCNGSADPTSTATRMSNVVIPSVSAASATPAIPLKPKLSEARFQGTYRMTWVLIRTTVPGAAKVTHSKWMLSPRCKSGGACDVALRSPNRYSARVSFLNGKYRFSRTIGAYWTCGGGAGTPGGYDIKASGNYSLQVSAMKLIDGEWIATKVKGIFAVKGNRGCGLSGAPTEQEAISGVRSR